MNGNGGFRCVKRGRRAWRIAAVSASRIAASRSGAAKDRRAAAAPVAFAAGGDEIADGNGPGLLDDLNALVEPTRAAIDVPPCSKSAQAANSKTGQKTHTVAASC